MEHILNLTLLYASTEGGEEHHGIGFNIFVYSAALFIVLLVFGVFVRKGLTTKVFKGWPAKMAEQLYLFTENLTLGVIGPHGRKYIPFVMYIWMYIFVGNFFAQIFEFSPTANWSMNLALSICTMLFVQWEGIKANGLFGHVRHFAGPALPIGLALFITPLIFMIEVMSEVMKIASLSLRLFFNMEGGHMVKTALNEMVPWFPLGGLLFPLKFLAVVVQALIFSLLTCVYLGLVTHHEGDHDHGHAGDHHEPATAH